MANFKTDVHRNKTKKWTTAQNYSYDGDEWGGYDDEEYVEEPPPPPPPPATSKPTGLRQRGQASMPSPQEPAPRMSTTSTVSSVNPLPPASPPISTQAFPAPPAFSSVPPAGKATSTSPPPPQSFAASQQGPKLRARSSFEYGDESSFSSGRMGAPLAPPQQTQPVRGDMYSHGPPQTHHRGDSEAFTALPQPRGHDGPHPAPPRPGPPFQAPPPQANPPQTRLPPQARAPYSAGSSAQPLPGQHFPPRKSSLSQGPRPDVEAILAPRTAPIASGVQTQGLPKAAEPETQTSPTFVRPADIYRRMEEEKQRASMDSNRPSLDNSRGRTSMQGPAELDAGSLRAPQLQAVPERRSEYGMDGFPIHEEAPSKLSVGNDFLPKLDRFSGFGDDLWGGASLSGVLSSNESTGTAPTRPADGGPASDSFSVPNVSQTTSTQEPASSQLKQQPSLGFRSAVEHAFETQPGATLSPASSSRYGSQRSANDSEIARTDSTAGISPIIGRDPSGVPAAKLTQRQDPLGHPVATIPEEFSPLDSKSVARPHSGDTITGNYLQESSTPATFPTGFRRSMTPPTGTNSPAQLPRLSTTTSNKPLEGEVSAMPPASRTSGHRASIDADHATDYSVRESDLAAVTKSPESPEHREAGDASRDARASFLAAHAPEMHVPPPLVSGPTSGDESRPGSPSKGRVADLAGKYNELHETRRNSGDSVSSWASSKRSLSPTKAQPQSTQSAFEHATEPLRPQLPGGWISYATTAASTDTAAPSPAPLTTDEERQLELGRPSEEPVPDFTPTQASSSHHAWHNVADAQMAGLSAAGAAIAAELEHSSGSGVASSDFAHSRGAAGAKLTPASHLSAAMPAPLRGLGPNSSPRGSDVSAERYSPLADGEYDSERLHDDIVRSLTPGRAGSAATTSTSSGFAPTNEGGSVIQHDTATLAHGNDSFGMARAGDGNLFSQNKAVSHPSDADAVAPLGKAPQPSKPMKHRFSWEDEDEDEDEAVDAPTVSVPPTSTSQLETADKGVKIPGTSAASDSVPDQLPEPEIAPAAPESQALARSEQPAPLRISTISTSTDPAELPAEPSLAQGVKEMPSSLNTHPVSPQSPDNAQATPQRIIAPAAVDPQVRSIPFKEVLAIKAFEPRMEKYEQSRNHFAIMDTGLERWLSHMVSSHPEHAGAGNVAAGGAVSSTMGGSVRNKITPGLSKLSKGSSTPYYQQYLDSGPSVNNAPAAPSGSSSGPIQDPNIKGRTMSQSRKDFFSTAGMIGGKATHSAMGLFAKGRSKLRQASTEKAE